MLLKKPNNPMSEKKKPKLSKLKTKTFPLGRSAKTGRFTTVEKTRDHPNTHVAERVPKLGGYDDTEDRPRPPRSRKR